MKKFQKYLSSEIGIEFKACLYFFAILFFYSMHQVIQGSLYANIIHMAEMIFTTYIMGYIQLLLLGNFDEGEQFGIKEGILSVFCSMLYTVISIVCGWYGGNEMAILLFFCYVLFCYICVFFVYKVKRDIDTVALNQELEEFKKRKGQGE